MTSQGTSLHPGLVDGGPLYHRVGCMSCGRHLHRLAKVLTWSVSLEHSFSLQLQSCQDHKREPRCDKGGLGPCEWPHCRNRRAETREKGETEKTKLCDLHRKKLCLNGAKTELSIIGLVSTETLKANSASGREALGEPSSSQPWSQCFPEAAAARFY